MQRNSKELDEQIVRDLIEYGKYEETEYKKIFPRTKEAVKEQDSTFLQLANAAVQSRNSENLEKLIIDVEKLLEIFKLLPKEIPLVLALLRPEHIREIIKNAECFGTVIHCLSKEHEVMFLQLLGNEYLQKITHSVYWLKRILSTLTIEKEIFLKNIIGGKRLEEIITDTDDLSELFSTIQRETPLILTLMNPEHIREIINNAECFVKVINHLPKEYEVMFYQLLGKEHLQKIANQVYWLSRILKAIVTDKNVFLQDYIGRNRLEEIITTTDDLKELFKYLSNDSHLVINLITPEHIRKIIKNSSDVIAVMLAMPENVKEYFIKISLGVDYIQGFIKNMEDFAKIIACIPSTMKDQFNKPIEQEIKVSVKPAFFGKAQSNPVQALKELEAEGLGFKLAHLSKWQQPMKPIAFSIEHIILLRYLIKDKKLTSEKAVEEISKLTTKQAICLGMLFDDNLRGEHLREWSSRSNKEFDQGHIDALTYFIQVKKDLPKEAISRIMNLSEAEVSAIVRFSML